MLTRPRYPTALSEARRTSSAHIKTALASVQDDAVLNTSRALLDSDIESSHGHSLAYVSWVLESAQLAMGGQTAREFAKTFLERPFDYSKTKAGISAVMLEVWLSRRGQALFKKFVETVLEGPDSYLLVFEGALSQTEFDRMRDQTEEFVAKFQPIVLAGQRNQDNMVSDLTIFEVRAASKLTRDAIAKTRTTDQLVVPELHRDERRAEHDNPVKLRPESAQDYSRVIAEGGISTAALAVVFGDLPRGRDTFTDQNGVAWVMEGDTWIPTMSVHEAAGGPPGLRRAPKGAWQSCQTCAYYEAPHDGKSGLCSQFDVSVSTVHLCDVWDGRETGSESVSSPRIRIVSSVDEDQDPVDPPEREVSRVYESTDSGVVRSFCGSWAVFEAPVEGGPSRTVIVAESNAMVVDVPLARVVETVDEIASCYPDASSWHRDRCIEHALAEWSRDEGTQVENAESCVAVAIPDAVQIGQRDQVVSESLIEAEKPEKSEKPGKKAKAEKPSPEGPPAPPPPPEPTDRMDDPEFYRDDLQTYYDVQILAGLSPKKAEQKTRQRFAVKELVVTPTGEVRSPGVVDRPNPPPMLPPGAEPGVPPAPIEQPNGAPDQAADVGAPAAKEAAEGLVGVWAKRTGAPREDVERLWVRAGEFVLKRDPLATPHEHQLVFRRLMGIAVEEALAEPQTIDDAFHRWVRHADGAVEDFEGWLADNHPRFLPHLALWLPSDLHESSRPPVGLTDAQEERYAKWRRLLNMTPAEIRTLGRRVSEATTSLSVSGLRAFSLGQQSTRRLLAMKSRPVTAWTEDDWNWAGRQVNSVTRLRVRSGPLLQDGKPTEKLVLLRAWGHEPRVRSCVSERAVLVSQRAGWRCRACHALVTESSVSYDTTQEVWQHSCGRKLVVPVADEQARRNVNRTVIDATPGTLPCLIGESKAPAFSALKSGKTDLTDDERTEVMRRKAVWHHGPNGKASPAVWKSIVDGQACFVTNTHRAYAVAVTLKGAINRYHAFVKSTA